MACGGTSVGRDWLFRHIPYQRPPEIPCFVPFLFWHTITAAKDWHFRHLENLDPGFTCGEDPNGTFWEDPNGNCWEDPDGLEWEIP